MLTISFQAGGVEHYAAFYPVSEFDEKKFIEDHSDDYYELSDENINLDIGCWGSEITVNVNGKELQFDDNFIESRSVSQGKKANSRQIVGADDENIAVYWMHDGTTFLELTWNEVDDFEESKLRISYLEGEVFDCMTYDGKEADDIHYEFAATGGFNGPEILFPGDASVPEW